MVASVGGHDPVPTTMHRDIGRMQLCFSGRHSVFFFKLLPTFESSFPSSLKLIHEYAELFPETSVNLHILTQHYVQENVIEGTNIYVESVRGSAVCFTVWNTNRH
jgi:hypothetical protein